MGLGLVRYTCLSFIAASAFIYHAFATREYFYPATLYLSTSKMAVAVMGNLVFATAMCLHKVLIKVFFGTLRDLEVEMIRERLSSAVMESLLALTIFRDEFGSFFVAMFATLVFIKVMHWLVQDRVDYVEVTPSVSLLQHLRLISFMSTLLLVDVCFLQYTIHGTIQSSGQSVMLLFAFEYVIQASNVIRYFLKYVMSVVDMSREGRWESKGIYVIYLELITDLLHLFVYCIFFVLVYSNYGLPLHLMRDLYSTFRNFRNRMVDFLRFRQVTARLDRFPDATAEDLQRSDGVCIICREEMSAAGSNKKLFCGHVFHLHCLRSWLERQQNCPTCRGSVFQRPEAAPAAAQPAAPPAPAPAPALAAAAGAVPPQDAPPAAAAAAVAAPPNPPARPHPLQALHHFHVPNMHRVRLATHFVNRGAADNQAVDGQQQGAGASTSTAGPSAAPPLQPPNGPHPPLYPPFYPPPGMMLPFMQPWLPVPPFHGMPMHPGFPPRTDGQEGNTPMPVPMPFMFPPLFPPMIPAETSPEALAAALAASAAMSAAAAVQAQPPFMFMPPHVMTPGVASHTPDAPGQGETVSPAKSLLSSMETAQQALQRQLQLMQEQISWLRQAQGPSTSSQPSAQASGSSATPAAPVASSSQSPLAAAVASMTETTSTATTSAGNGDAAAAAAAAAAVIATPAGEPATSIPSTASTAAVDPQPTPTPPGPGPDDGNDEQSEIRWRRLQRFEQAEQP